MIETLPLWVEAIIALLLVTSGLLALIGAVGMIRLKEFFQRMHPPALAFTAGAWCVTLAYILYFSFGRHTLELHAWMIIVLLSITVPVTTIMLARTALFRLRQSGSKSVPPLLSRVRAEPGQDHAGN
ncbi:Na+/H+ antiporter subunit G [Variovorax sp. VNK109]|jgi:multicomponent K+:H+ antiporter subunit G|uniref:Na+/H+ antiporter subunit G n=1 Tax=Variovorax sp. VNK109 TaxID=3400919 RepID=UPI003C122B10